MLNGTHPNKALNHPDNVGANRSVSGTFLPGRSGNPAGRPKGKTLTERLRAALDQAAEQGKTVADGLIDAATEAARNGDFRYFKEIIDRIDGPITQRVEGEVTVVKYSIEERREDRSLSEADGVSSLDRA